MKYFVYCRKSSESEDRQIKSIESQRSELQRAFGRKAGIEIVAVITESKSAKTPGRPQFDTMLTRIEAGEASGIIAWAPDRLARNSVDGGKIVYLLDQGLLQDLRFATYTFENNSQGKFMLSIMFGQSKYYSDALSENVRRGLRTKVEQGWRPSRPPIGYLTDPLTREIVPDPVRFPLVRRIFELVLAGQLNVKQITVLAREDWGLCMRAHRQSGSRPISLPLVYKLLSNPFYAGSFVWNGRTYKGRHEPMLTLAEFDAVQNRLGRGPKARPKKHGFAYTGLMRCGACGHMVTAERRKKPSGRTYVYYHCTKRGLGPRCPERAVTEADLDEQFRRFVADLTIPAELEEALQRALNILEATDDGYQAARTASLNLGLKDIETRLRELTDIRVRQLIADDEFLASRERLLNEQLRLSEAAANPEIDMVTKFELARTTISFSIQAVEFFQSADPDERKSMLKTISFEPALVGGKLRIQAAKPFILAEKISEIRKKCTQGDDVRTHAVVKAWIADFAGWLSEDAERAHLLRAALNQSPRSP